MRFGRDNLRLCNCSGETIILILLIISYGECHGEARNAVLSETLKLNGEHLAHQLASVLPQLPSALHGALGSCLECVSVLGLTDPNGCSTVLAFCLLGAHDFKLFGHHLLVLDTLGRPFIEQVGTFGHAHHHTLVTLCHKLVMILVCVLGGPSIG